MAFKRRVLSAGRGHSKIAHETTCDFEPSFMLTKRNVKRNVAMSVGACIENILYTMIKRPRDIGNLLSLLER